MTVLSSSQHCSIQCVTYGCFQTSQGYKSSREWQPPVPRTSQNYCQSDRILILHCIILYHIIIIYCILRIAVDSKIFKLFLGRFWQCRVYRFRGHRCSGCPGPYVDHDSRRRRTFRGFGAEDLWEAAQPERGWSMVWPWFISLCPLGV